MCRVNNRISVLEIKGNCSLKALKFKVRCNTEDNTDTHTYTVVVSVCIICPVCRSISVCLYMYMCVLVYLLLLQYLSVCIYFAQVVYFASETFHYHKADRMRIKMRRFATEQWPDTIGKKVSSGLPLKVSQVLFSSYIIMSSLTLICMMHMTMS